MGENQDHAPRLVDLTRRKRYTRQLSLVRRPPALEAVTDSGRDCKERDAAPAVFPRLAVVTDRVTEPRAAFLHH